MLAGLAISNPFGWLSRRWTIAGIDLVDTVTVTTSNVDARHLEITFSNCILRGGLQHDLLSATDPYDIDGIVFANCRLGASIKVQAARVSMQADTVDGSLHLRLQESVAVQACWFRGGAGTAIYVDGSSPSGVIENTLIQDYTNGIAFTNSLELTIRSNIIQRMSEYGMYLRGESGLISGNRVTDCTTALRADLFNTALLENTFLRMRGAGVWFDQPFGLRVDRNIIGRCGGHGLAIEFGDGGDFRLMQNTIFGNAGSGITVLYANDNYLLVQQNVLFGNVEWALDVGQPQAAVALGCNDWFGNARGSVRGAIADATDISVDPSFCDIASGSVSLYSDSPLLGYGSCSPIGARGVGCSPPTLKAFDVASGRAGLGIAWEFDASTPVESWVERADESAGRWDSLGTGMSTATNGYEMLDGAVAPGRSYHYRIGWKDRGAVVHGLPVPASWTDAGRLSSVTPNPAYRELSVEWILSKPGPTDIRVYDLAGREVSLLARGSFGVGRHQVRWDGRWDGRGVAPAGMYVVRISSGERATSHRVLLIR